MANAKGLSLRGCFAPVAISGRHFQVVQGNDKTYRPIASVAALTAQPLAALPPYGCGVPLAGCERPVQGYSTAQGRWCTSTLPDVSFRGAKRRGNLVQAAAIFQQHPPCKMQSRFLETAFFYRPNRRKCALPARFFCSGGGGGAGRKAKTPPSGVGMMSYCRTIYGRSVQNLARFLEHFYEIDFVVIQSVDIPVSSGV